MTTLPVRHLDYTVIFARDLPRMRQFYGETLGFALHRSLGDQWLEYRIGSCILALTVRGMMFDDAPTPTGALSLQLAFRVAPSEVAACVELLRERGVEPLGPVTDQTWGHRTLFFRDPDGNVLEIYAEL